MAYKLDILNVLENLQDDFPHMKRVPVKTADIGASYVSGSEGQTKAEQYYDTSNVLRATVTYKYEETETPEFWTDMITDVKVV